MHQVDIVIDCRVQQPNPSDAGRFTEQAAASPHKLHKSCVLLSMTDCRASHDISETAMPLTAGRCCALWWAQVHPTATLSAGAITPSSILAARPASRPSPLRPAGDSGSADAAAFLPPPLDAPPCFLPVPCAALHRDGEVYHTEHVML